MILRGVVLLRIRSSKECGNLSLVAVFGGNRDRAFDNSQQQSHNFSPSILQMDTTRVLDSLFASPVLRGRRDHPAIRIAIRHGKHLHRSVPMPSLIHCVKFLRISDMVHLHLPKPLGKGQISDRPSPTFPWSKASNPHLHSDR